MVSRLAGTSLGEFRRSLSCRVSAPRLMKIFPLNKGQREGEVLRRLHAVAKRRGVSSWPFQTLTAILKAPRPLSLRLLSPFAKGNFKATTAENAV
jgi:hypothetical protein